ncbi:MAG: DEAD/DEAH box helicase [Candidatus Omnitrophica bacterium]|nr:ATP-dependent RNA helicase DbpA [bacterium]NUN98281.1 DEAD/DEAH box helicase [Candidatus Omnitrophota bacterium]
MDTSEFSSSEAAPPEDRSLPEMTLAELPATLQSAVDRAGWKALMPVQAKAIPYMLAERDLMVQSRTGSGKTGAFILPILMRVNPSLARCQALVLVPTRELALQVSREAEMLGEGTGVRTVVVYGGVGYGNQIEGFRKGAHLVVGTPGRILDHLLKGSLSLDDVSILVFDEADRMMSMGFYPDMEQIRRFLPRERSGFMFSATYPASVRRLALHFLRNPEFLSLSEGAVHVPQTRHAFYVAPAMDKDRVLVRIIEAENPSSAIIFCNTKAKVGYVTQVLQRFGYDADQLTSDLAQRARENVLQRLYKGTLRFLVATDVAARGIDVANLSHVFLYDFPEDQESYIHRAGRTGRAGAAGVAISIVDLMEKTELGRLAKRYSIEMEAREAPTEESIQTVVSERVVALLEAKLRNRDRIQMERMRRFIPLAKSLGESDDELAIIAMLIDDYYQETLHAPPPEPPAEAGAPREESPDGGGRRRRSGRRRG